MNHILNDIDKNIGEMKLVTKEFEEKQPLSSSSFQNVMETVENEPELTLESLKDLDFKIEEFQMDQDI
jgi:hypothetical protein